MLLNSDDLSVMTTTELYRARSWSRAGIIGEIQFYGISIIDDLEDNFYLIDKEIFRRKYQRAASPP